VARRSAYFKAFCDAGEKSVGANIFLIVISTRCAAGLASGVRNLSDLVAGVCVFIVHNFVVRCGGPLRRICQRLCVFCGEEFLSDQFRSGFRSAKANSL